MWWKWTSNFWWSYMASTIKKTPQYYTTLYVTVDWEIEIFYSGVNIVLHLNISNLKRVHKVNLRIKHLTFLIKFKYENDVSVYFWVSFAPVYIRFTTECIIKSQSKFNRMMKKSNEFECFTEIKFSIDGFCLFHNFLCLKFLLIHFVIFDFCSNTHTHIHTHSITS